MAKMYFVRHGQASFSADNYDQLSPLGIEQAGLLGGYFAEKNITPEIVVTGSMKRHIQTATHSLETFGSANNLQLDLAEDSRWNEYDHQNILAMYKPELATPQGIRQFLADSPDPKTAFQTHFVAAMNQWINATDSAGYTESWLHFTTRIEAALSHLVNAHFGKTIFIYSSGGTISIIASMLMGLPLENFIHINTTLVNAGITKAIARGSNKQVLLSTLNEHHVFERQSDKKFITYT